MLHDILMLPHGLIRTSKLRYSTKLLPKNVEISRFHKSFRNNWVIDSYLMLEDDFKRLSRGSKMSYIAVGIFLFVPTGLIFMTGVSSVQMSLLNHQFKLSSVALSWQSATCYSFEMANFGNRGAATYRDKFSLLFCIIGACGSLFIGDYNIKIGYAFLIISYALYVIYLSYLKYTRLLPHCIVKPSLYLSIFNIIILVSGIKGAMYATDEFTKMPNEQFIEEFEKKHASKITK